MEQHKIEYLKRLVAALAEWQLCMSYNDSYFGEPAGLVKRTSRELTKLIESVERTTSPVSQMTDEQIVDEQQKALNDMLIYGTGFTVGGKHAPIEKVMMFSNPEVTRAAPSKDDESGLPG